MQPTEGFSVPRRTLDVEDYIDILRRHKSWIFGPFLLTLVGSVVGVYLWPDSYSSQAVVQIIPQQVPQTLVQSAVVQDMTQRISQMANTILSRTALTTIINTMDLYKRERSDMPIEDVIEKMRRSINITPVSTFGQQTRDVPAFTVTFSYSNRLDAQRVVGELVTRFMDENQKTRSTEVYNTTQLLQDQAERAKRELDQVATRLTQFRLQNQGRLPEQVDTNLQRINALNTNATVLFNNISRVNQEKLTLEAQLGVYRDNLNSLGKDSQAAAAVQTKSQQLAEVDREIEALDRNLTDLRRVYKETFPDIQTYRGRLENAQARRERILADEAKAAASAEPAAPIVNPQILRERRTLEGNITLLESNIRNKDLELAELQKQVKRVNDDINSARTTLQAAPVGQQEYMNILREETLARDRYINASERLAKAEISQDVEDRKQGETLALLDPANLPTSPTSPKRGMVISIGAALGLLLGIAVAGAREIKDTSLKNLKDVRAYTQMAILGSVPLLENDFVVRRRKRIAWLGWTTACLLAVIVMAGSVVYYYATQV